MQVFHSISEVRGLEGCALALGNFDGVHVGHRTLFAEAAKHASPVALTFHPHPGKVLQPDLAPKLIHPLQRRLELLAGCGLAAVIVQPFTLEYARTGPQEFEESVFGRVGAKHVIVGLDFTYGSQRRGTVATLEAAARQRGAQVHPVSPVTVDGVVASSTKVREYILEGRVGAAHRLLGRYFDLDGTVVPGQGRGRGIGFPTANVDTQAELRPAPGVYAVRTAVRTPSVEGNASAGSILDIERQAASSEPLGPWLPGAANIGVKPTFGGGEVTIEVHLIDFQGDLYGKSLRVQFLERLRPEQRFGSVAELATQIRRDVEAARAVVARVVG